MLARRLVGPAFKHVTVPRRYRSASKPANMATSTITPAAHKMLSFWFGETFATDPWGAVPAPQYAIWFAGGEALDSRMRAAFEPDVQKAAAGEYDAWEKTADPREHLALVLLQDQVVRNIYRGTPRAFATDARALAAAKRLVGRPDFTALRPVERLFCFVPFEHSEDLGDQVAAVAAYTALVAEAQSKNAADMVDMALKFVDFGEQHRVVVARFGRFPHRNAILGRANTAEETEFLKTHKGF